MSKSSKKKAPSSSSDSDSGPDDRNSPPPRKVAKESNNAKSAGNSSQQKKQDGGGGDDGSNCWTLEKLRKVRINEFRGRKMVDIREFYEKNGELLPGKKGISLSITQWRKLLEVADEVNNALD